MMAEKAGFEWVPSDSHGAGQLFRRLETPQTNWFRFPEHAAKLLQKFRDARLSRHLLTAEPYRRAWGRLRRKLRERALKKTG